jgi:hypothetical protein
MLRAYKINVLELREGQVLGNDSIQVEDDTEFISIPIETDEAEKRRARAIYEKKKQEQFSRAKIKRETQRQVEEYLSKRETDR